MTDPHDLYTTLVKPALPVFLAAGVIYAVRFFLRRFRGSAKSRLGEALVNRGTFRLLDKALYQGFSELYVPRPDGDGLTQVEYVVVSPFGIFVIGTKDCTGWIDGSENQPKWTQTFSSGGKCSFQNPIWQNRLHIAALAKLLNLPVEKFRPVVFFMGGSAFKAELPEYVIDTSLTSYIVGFEEVLLTPEEVAAAKAALVDLVKRTNKRAAKRELEKRVKRGK